MKEKISLRRLISLFAILAATASLTVVLCMTSSLYPDEWICVAYVDVIFYIILVFELEYERAQQYTTKNRRIDFLRFAIIYCVCCLIVGVSAFFIVYTRPVMIIVVLVSFYFNEYLGFICGAYFCTLLTITVSGNYYELIAMLILTIAASILTKILNDKSLRAFFYITVICINVLIFNIFYYLENKDNSIDVLVVSAIVGIATSLISAFIAMINDKYEQDTIEDRLIAIISIDYPEVVWLKKYSFSEFNHANFVSTIAYNAAKSCGLDASLAAAAGFYYRIGQWQKFPCVSNGTERAQALNFPDKVIDILSEYYGITNKPSTPESALVHMVDALIVKLDHIKSSIDNNTWNHEILLIQTLNELSASGIYDESGLSMNHFLKIRDYLAKEELLR